MLGHADLQWMLCQGQTQSLQYVHCLVTARWIIVAVLGGLENTPLDICTWRVQRNSDGAVHSVQSPPLSRKRNCKHQAHAKRCILHALRPKTHLLTIPGTPTDETVLLHMPICSSMALKDRYMQWARIWGKQVSLGEK